MSSTTAGSVFLVLILYAYIHVHRKAAPSENSGPMADMAVSVRINRSETNTSGMPTKPAPASDMKSIAHDHWLIARFIVCFGLSNVLQVYLIVYYMLYFDRKIGLAKQGGPDYSLHYVIDDLAVAMPGVSSGLLLFIVFGTTAPLRREYRKWLQPCRRKCQGRDGPIMVAPLNSLNAANSEAFPGRRRTFDEADSFAVDEGARRVSVSSVWELPPMDFDDFSEKDVLPEWPLGEDGR